MAHKAIWNVKNVNELNSDARLDCTITEMIFVSNQILDGSYILNLQIASFENDALVQEYLELNKITNSWQTRVKIVDTEEYQQILDEKEIPKYLND